MKPLSAGDRRAQIRTILANRQTPITGSELSQILGVSRQIIVQDVALLRAAGDPILATPQGYLRAPASPGRPFRAVFACRHGLEGTADELDAMVDQGLRVVDVTVEHLIYGELRGMLMVETRADVRDFIQRVQEGGATLLSTLTHGVHLHTVEAARPEQLDRAKQSLREKGFLVGEE
jgi:transcriptional regulator of NAD metabolism